MGDGNFWINALVGAVASVVLAFVPFSTVIGGAIAGYLQRRNGLKVGAAAGALLAVPTLLGLLLIVPIFFVEPSLALFAVAVYLLIVVVGLLYTVGLCALGGIVGEYLSKP